MTRKVPADAAPLSHEEILAKTNRHLIDQEAQDLEDSTTKKTIGTEKCSEEHTSPTHKLTGIKLGTTPDPGIPFPEETWVHMEIRTHLEISSMGREDRGANHLAGTLHPFTQQPRWDFHHPMWTYLISEELRSIRTSDEALNRRKHLHGKIRQLIQVNRNISLRLTQALISTKKTSADKDLVPPLRT